MGFRVRGRCNLRGPELKRPLEKDGRLIVKSEARRVYCTTFQDLFRDCLVVGFFGRLQKLQITKYLDSGILLPYLEGRGTW